MGVRPADFTGTDILQLAAGLSASGRMRVYVEPVLPQPRLWILGHGRVAECLCHFGALLGFAVIVDDAMAASERFPEATRVTGGDSDDAAATPAAGDFAVVATQHRGDHEALIRLLASEVGHVALTASRKHARLVLACLGEAGFDRQALDRVHTPAGLALGVRTPEEIALSVITEIVLVRRSRADREPVPATEATLAHAETLRVVGGE